MILTSSSQSLGGRVEAKVPRQGYVLVQPGTAEEERLRLCWTSSVGERKEEATELVQRLEELSRAMN